MTAISACTVSPSKPNDSHSLAAVTGRIAAELNGRGIVAGRGGRWHAETVRRQLAA